ncbi:MAG: 1-deoxy-D-xylulose-5-phosphate reductoisomerase [Clostridia bacterium]|nr:1-deoxy-D-xylulose-5-phosphate reductoisomerase [Clostridia bacterium]
MRNQQNTDKTELGSLTVLGSTGSVGEQALDVALSQGIRVDALVANQNARRVEEQARKFSVKACAMADPEAAAELKTRLADTSTKVYAGEKGILDLIGRDFGQQETVVNAILGEAGLKPTIAALKAKKRLALANKESLVCAGTFVMDLAKKNGVPILPVDSEHSAIFQCLRSGSKKEIKRIFLTASGGPFYGMTTEQLSDVTLEKTLAHPTWNMGAKITVDSATLMNKGFEVIEAVHLFGVSVDQIKVLVHRESIMHSAIEYVDNSVIAQLSKPDMRLCVQYAITHPGRTKAVIEELDLTKLSGLTFREPDETTFRLLALAKKAIREGGALPAVLNAANEVAVAAFLQKKLSFLGIFDLVENTVSSLEHAKCATTIEEVFDYDAQARRLAYSSLSK